MSAVIVDFHAGSALSTCIDSLYRNGVSDIVVVENGDPGSSHAVVGPLAVKLVEPAINLGYGRGVNRGAAATTATPYLLVSNPDVIVADGAVATLVEFLDQHPSVGMVGPQILRPDGTVYPSLRVFPNFWLAGLHALLEPVWANNPATRRYRSARSDGGVEWVSGAFFLIRRDVFEEVGGFDERYFMFAEDMALCWNVRAAGWDIGAAPDAQVTHIEGLSRRLVTRQMLWAHHRSALRFEWQTASGPRKLLVPLAALVLALRLAVVTVVKGRG